MSDLPLTSGTRTGLLSILTVSVSGEACADIPGLSGSLPVPPSTEHSGGFPSCRPSGADDVWKEPVSAAWTPTVKWGR